MRIGQNVLFDQFFKIACLDVMSQLLVGSKLLKAHERSVLVVQPGVEYVDAVHKPLRVCSVIGFAELEFKVVDTGHERLFVDPAFRLIREDFSDDLFKTVRVLALSSSGFNREVRLQNAVVIGAGNVAAYARLEQSFAHRCPGHGQKGIIEDIICDHLLDAQGISGDHIPCEVGVFFLVFLVGDRVHVLDTLHLRKWSLLLYFRVDLDFFKC